MYQFFIPCENVYNDRLLITGPDVNHIRNVLRMRVGERIRVSAEDGKSWFCQLAEINENSVLAQIVEADEAGTELPVRITLYQGLPKADKMELIIQKTVELGVHEIVPVAMKNCVMKLDEKKADARVKRWQAIAESAAKQSKRTVIPQVGHPLSWKLALQDAFEKDILLVPYENERGMDATRELLGSIRPGQTIGIIIGPEGGFSPNEIQQIKEEQQRLDQSAHQTSESQSQSSESPREEQEAESSLPGENHEAESEGAEGTVEASHRTGIISLGKRILRTETAGPAVLAMLVYELDS